MNPTKGEKLYVNIGRFKIIYTDMILTDPYLIDTKIIIQNVESGYWRASTMVEYYDKWQYRNMELIICHLSNFVLDESDKWEYLDDIQIDNAIIAVYDRYKVISASFDTSIEKVSMNHKRTILLKDGILSQTGFGVGSYPIYVLKNNQQKVIGIKIVFKNKRIMKSVNKLTNEKTSEKSIIRYVSDGE
jgi:hypothetical protein